MKLRKLAGAASIAAIGFSAVLTVPVAYAQDAKAPAKAAAKAPAKAPAKAEAKAPAKAATKAETKKQFFPVLAYRTGAYAPNGAPWANGFVDYMKLTNARGGVNGVKLLWEECETGYATDR
ncbi:MAG: ABC transporter substrate-binding protein, partial [Sulfuritalea sp.]|nr:ABC transporter substrate-binding protein [Sulfuritalea sp.]